MPELSQLKGIGLPTQTVSLLKPDWSNPVAFEPDKSGLARASVFNKLSETLADLPAMAARNITAGRKLRDDKRKSEVDAAGDAIVKDKLSRGALEGLTIGPNGTTYRAPDTETADEVEMRKLRREYLQGQIDKQGSADTSVKPKTPYENALAQIEPDFNDPSVGIDSVGGALSSGVSSSDVNPESLIPSGARTTPALESVQAPKKAEIDKLTGVITSFNSDGSPKARVYPNGRVEMITPDKKEKEEGVIFNSIEEITNAGLNPETAVPIAGPDGKINGFRVKTVGRNDKSRGNLTEAESKNVGFLGRMVDAEKGAEKLASKFDPTSVTGAAKVAAAASKMPFANSYAGADAQMYRTEKLNFLSGVLRKDSGAAITDNEERFYGDMLFPKMGDEKETVALKKRKRDVAVEGIKNGLPLEAIEKAIRDVSTDNTKSVAPKVAPQMTPTQKAALEEYKSGVYDSDPAKKARAEALLKRAGLL